MSEPINHLKQRMTVISNYRSKPRRMLLAIGVTALVGLCTTLQTKRVYADQATNAKNAAIEAMNAWLLEVDQGQYEKSWQDAAKSFQQAVTVTQWQADVKSARQPLGECTSRKLVSALQQTDPRSNGQVLKGEFVIAQFDTSFANLKYAVETVTFQKESDGSWKAAGYYIKPGK